MKPFRELIVMAFAMGAVVLIILFVHKLVEEVEPVHRIQHMIPWLETLLVITVFAAFVGKEVKSFILFLFELLRSKPTRPTYQRGQRNIEEPRHDIWGYFALTVVIGISAWIYTLLTI